MARISRRPSAGGASIKHGMVGGEPVAKHLLLVRPAIQGPIGSGLAGETVTVARSAAVRLIGANAPSAVCEPAQKGCVLACPQAYL